MQAKAWKHADAGEHKNPKGDEDVIIAIQCASSKSEGAGCLRARDGRKVIFVARPDLAPREESIKWARPDDPSDVPMVTWRQQLEQLVRQGHRPEALHPAFRLYRPAAYRTLVEKFGQERVYILSAGWGLVRSDYPLPMYDITFSGQADPYKRRHSGDNYKDFMQIATTQPGPIVFLGGRDYLPLFRSLVGPLRAPKVVMSRREPSGTDLRSQRDKDWLLLPFMTSRKTNWHYACAEALCRDPDLVTRHL